MPNGRLLVLCRRCTELVVAPFVDRPLVFGGEPSRARSVFGAAESGRAAIDLVGALLARDAAAWRSARGRAAAQPGAAVDALALLAIAAGLDRPRLQLLAVEHELGLLEERP